MTPFLIYLGLGFISYNLLLLRGNAIVDSSTKSSTWGFKLIILPGVLVFWPLLIYKWIRS